MAIRTSAGVVELKKINETGFGPPPFPLEREVHPRPRPTPLEAGPVIVFPNLSPDTSQNFSFSIWARVRTTISGILTHYNCVNGSQMLIMQNGTYWQLNMRHGSNFLPIINLSVVQHDRWTLICFSKNGPTATVYIGVEGTVDPHLAPVEITQVAQTDYSAINDPFKDLRVSVFPGMEVCCFKFWKAALTINELKTQGNKWDAVGTPAPIWASPLRTPGDISSIATPFLSNLWTDIHAYSSIISQSSLRITIASLPDPSYMANNSYCPTWLYPILTNNPFALIHCDPLVNPSVVATYDGNTFIKFEDRGSVPFRDYILQDIKYYGGYFMPNEFQVVPPTDVWAFYINENGTRIDTRTPNDRFDRITVEPVVPRVPPATLTPNNMYIWKYGGAFTYPADSRTTALTYLDNIRMLVTYLGYPLGIPFTPEVELSGLFIVVNDRASDKYNGEWELKIPNPTIRTAYIGE